MANVNSIIEQVGRRGFSFGTNDCCTLAEKVIAEVAGSCTWDRPRIRRREFADLEADYMIAGLTAIPELTRLEEGALRQPGDVAVIAGSFRFLEQRREFTFGRCGLGVYDEAVSLVVLDHPVGLVHVRAAPVARFRPNRKPRRRSGLPNP